MDTMQDADAQRFADKLAEILSTEYKLVRFTPSIKIGRRYLVAEHTTSGRSFMVQIDAVEMEVTT